MNTHMKSAAPSRKWRVDEPVRRELGPVIGGTEPDRRAHLDGLHRNGTAALRTITPFIRAEAAPMEAPAAEAARRFGFPPASVIDRLEGALRSDMDSVVLAEKNGLSLEGASRRGLGRRALALAMLFIEENLEDDFSLPDLAKAAGQSRSHFCRRFRMSTGETPMGYVRRRRILRAKRLLLEGKRKTCDIASALGFFDQSHFTRTFRRFTGLAPGEYVRMCEVAEVAI